MKCLGDNADHFHLLSRHFPSRWILAAVQTTRDGQPLRCRRARNQAHNSLVVPKGLPSPVGGDKRKQPVFYLVPFAGSRREVADLDGERGRVRQLLQFELPQAPTISV